jgi:hypothetical protein
MLNIYNILPYEKNDVKLTLMHVASIHFVKTLNLDLLIDMDSADLVKEIKKQEYTSTVENFTQKAFQELAKKYKDEVAFSTTQHKGLYTKEFTGKQLLSLIK